MSSNPEAVPIPKRVFLSSTSLDMVVERNAVARALRQLQDALFIGMEYFGSHISDPKDLCLKEVRNSHVYVGVFGNRYGYVDPPSGLSMTELEYHEAQGARLPCLIYLKETKELGDEQVEALKSRLKANHVVTFYRNPDHLATRVVLDLTNLFSGKSKNGSSPNVNSQRETWRRSHNSFL